MVRTQARPDPLAHRVAGQPAHHTPKGPGRLQPLDRPAPVAPTRPLLLTPAPARDFALESHLKVVLLRPGGQLPCRPDRGVLEAIPRRVGPLLLHPLRNAQEHPQTWCEPTGQGRFLADAADAKDVYLRIEKRGAVTPSACARSPMSPGVRSAPGRRPSRRGMLASWARPSATVGRWSLDVDNIRLQPLPHNDEPAETCPPSPSTPAGRRGRWTRCGMGSSSSTSAAASTGGSGRSCCATASSPAR